MSIDRISIGNGAIERTLGTPGTDEGRNADKSKSNVGDDAITLSSTAKDVERISAKLDQSRADRLNQVGQAIDGGTYRVPGVAIAQKLIEFNKL
jgi:flagellar biosynthesis anti-sigma factor FlgM